MKIVQSLLKSRVVQRSSIGITKGKAEGRAGGEAMGKAEEKANIAKKLLAMGLHTNEVAKATGLKVDEIKALKKKR